MSKEGAWTVILLTLTLGWQVFVEFRKWSQEKVRFKFRLGEDWKQGIQKQLYFYMRNESHDKEVVITRIVIQKVDGSTMQEKSYHAVMSPREEHSFYEDNILSTELLKIEAIDTYGNVYRYWNLSRIKLIERWLRKHSLTW